MTLRWLAFGLVAAANCIGSVGIVSVAQAQQPTSPRHVGVVLLASSPEDKGVQQLPRGLLDAGYVEGRDIVIEWRLANSDYDVVPRLIEDLVERNVDAIVVTSTPATRVAKLATSKIPIVMALVADPVESGLVASLSRPGGNVTGLSFMTTELSPKRLQLLKEALPRLTRVAVLWNPATPWHTKVIELLKGAAPSLSVEVTPVGVRTLQEFGPAFTAVTRARAQALYVVEDPLFFGNRTVLLKLVSRARLPAVYEERGFVDEGGLMSYGANFAALWYRSAWYVDKVLKGANPADLPVEQPTKFELVVNLKTAKELGITIPKSIVLRADEVIR